MVAIDSIVAIVEVVGLTLMQYPCISLSLSLSPPHCLTHTELYVKVITHWV